MSEESRPLAEAALKGCAANVGPLIGVDLEVGEVSIETSSEVPDGSLAVLPLSVEIDDQPFCSLTLWSPIDEVATLARRLLDDDTPDKTRPLGDDELDAVGEVLNLMSGAVDQSVRESVNPNFRSRPLTWWRTEDPGDNGFPEGEWIVASASIAIPSAGTVSVFFRISPKLFSSASETQSKRNLGSVLLLGLEQELLESLQGILSQAQLQVDVAEPATPELEELLGSSEAIFLSGDRNGGFDLLRQLRLDNRSWQVPSIFCLREPTKTSVLQAMDCGASHVMAVPTDEITVLRVLRSAKP